MKIKIIACIIVRTTSTRLHLKVLRTIYNNMSILDVIVNRLKMVHKVDKIYLCTSKEKVDDILEDVAERNQISIYRGSADEVIERMISVGEIEKASQVIRITGDNVFVDPYILEKQIDFHLIENLEYTRTENLPIGVTAEIINLNMLKKCYLQIDPEGHEYLMFYMFNPDVYKCGVLLPKENQNLSNYTLTVDTPEDLIRTKQIVSYLGDDYFKADLNEIIQIINQYKIDNAKNTPNSMIKLPHDKLISFDDFRKDINNRILKSLTKTIDLEI
ncbi:cytidylyltransferase domain-containing protein [Halalkalibacter alkalisediminis]|uniref:Cytidylyltransferase domain-containing protein n=1 Tax=Halalkalibacter alkalisediminis TaxID=935616 RepID=A0ABV6NMF3_9BACI|nr:hypothetical protein [Halalkalibacter alkalisediminis]